MKLALAADHGGFELKEKIKEYLKDRKDLSVKDLGTHSTDSVDYPLYGKACAEAVVKGEADKGIVFCGTGIGICMAASKVKGIRCALATNVFMAEMSRKHNDANILALGGRVLSFDEAKKIVDIWLSTDFEGGRHQRRIDALE
jgi:ribose 5-phosphate isomerase B